PQGSKARRAVDVGRARTPARASSSHPKVGRSRCRSSEGKVLINVGIHISKEHLDVSIRPEKRGFRVKNDESGFAEICWRSCAPSGSLSSLQEATRCFWSKRS